MEHIIIVDLGGGYYNLKPEEGYLLCDKRSQKAYSEVETRDILYFIAI